MCDEIFDPAAYACAIGSAILALNTVESEMSDLLQQLGHPEEVQGWRLSDKVEALKKAGLKEADPEIKAEFDRVIAEICRLADERNNFAHALLWFDPFTDTHQRRYARLVGPRKQRRLKIEHDARSAQEITATSLEIDALALSVGALATRLRNR